MWWRFRKHRLAMASGAFIILLIIVAVFPEFIAPYDPTVRDPKYVYATLHKLHFVDRSGARIRIYPHVYALKMSRDPVSLALTYTQDANEKIRLGFFVKGTPYKLFGLIPGNIHFFAPVDQSKRFFLLGGDPTGRDVFSRLIYATRVSMSAGLLGVVLSLVLGILLGGISGYYGGAVDTVIQRTIELLRSIPAIPLWLGLAAALPPNWPPLKVYFWVTIILALRGWTTLARVVRGRFLSLREEDFVLAARLDGVSELRIIGRHMVPSFLSHIIAAVSLAIPQMILNETALSFLGLGLREPAISWGVLLQSAQDVRTVGLAPWLLLPALAVVTVVLTFNFLGDGLRDAADPYG